MFRILLSFALFYTFITAAQSQAVRRYHESHLLDETTAALEIDAPGHEVEVVNWSGSDVLVEVTVTSNAGSVAILNQLQKEGRYELAIVFDGGYAKLTAKHATRKSIKVRGAEMDEVIKYRISIPDTFPAEEVGGSNGTFTKLN